jgi:hypothetical protein
MLRKLPSVRGAFVRAVAGRRIVFVHGHSINCVRRGPLPEVTVAPLPAKPLSSKNLIVDFG